MAAIKSVHKIDFDNGLILEMSKTPKGKITGLLSSLDYDNNGEVNLADYKKWGKNNKYNDQQLRKIMQRDVISAFKKGGLFRHQDSKKILTDLFDNLEKNRVGSQQACLDLTQEQSTIYQLNPLRELLEGECKGITSVKKFLGNGKNFGLGTYDEFGGEAAISGVPYQITSNRKTFTGPTAIAPDAVTVAQPLGDVSTPFMIATTIKFSSETQILIPEGNMKLNDLKQRLDSELKNREVFHAIRVTGNFKRIKVSVVPDQILNAEGRCSPYADIHKPTVEYQNTSAEIVIIWTPLHMEGLNTNRGIYYHPHVLIKDNQGKVIGGGHLLELETAEELQVQVEPKCRLELGIGSGL